MNSQLFVLPSEIERETGFGKDQLRKWRQRFGFPPLEMQADGKPAHSRETVKQLLLIKRLFDGGFRPAQVVGKTAAEREKLHRSLDQSLPAGSVDASAQAFIEQLKQPDLAGFEALLAKQSAKQTLLGFIGATVAPLMVSIGYAWRRNELDIHHEHLCSSCIERYLQGQILSLKPRRGYPRSLFALPPGESHFLGLLMIEAVLAEQGARTINIGTGVPLNNLKLAAVACKVDVVALSFSFAYPMRDIVPTLLQFRRLLPASIQIWAGGAALTGIRKHPKGVRIFSDLEAAVLAHHELAAHNAGRKKSAEPAPTAC